MLFDFETLSPHERYKLLVSTVVPRPIAWVVTQDEQGRNNAAPYSFFNVFAEDPALVIIGVGGRAMKGVPPEKDTATNIRTSREFVVNLVSAANGEAMNITAIDFPPGVDELIEAGLTTIASTRVKPPRIAESPVAFECERFTTLEIGHDRSLVLGRVVAMHIIEDAVMDAAKCYIDTPKLDLIGRMAGAGGYIHTRDAFEIARIKESDWVRKG
jgi:flavin reductase (DIM6/NTAB) family NADH-FMN oxidoreductase RutF